MSVRAAAPRVLSVDDSGIVLHGRGDVVLDVLLDGRRIWSFWSARDTEAGEGDQRVMAWPRPMKKFLDGQTRLMIRSHVAEEVLFDEERQFGTSTERIAVVNNRGLELSMDKSGRMQATFDTRTADQVTPLLDSVEEVLGALRTAGVEAFPAYGTLLGAVRDGALIGHDSDADLGYISSHSHPADVARESFQLQRRLADMGYSVSRYSGAGFQVQVTESDGSLRGLDVFTGYFDDGQLILLGEVRTPFEREWIFPLGTTTLEGRTLPAPAEPDRLLAAMYGESWRTPDPAFKFETPDSTTKRLNDWFRGTTVNRSTNDRRNQKVRDERPYPKPDPLARMLVRREGPQLPARVVDVGCGRGSNAWWLARRGIETIGLDYSPRGFEFLQRKAADRPDVPLEFGTLNLLELRSTLAQGARVGAAAGPTVVMARHLADALPPLGREHLWRFLELACSGGGRAYLDFLLSPVEDDAWAQRNLLTPLETDGVVTALEARGATVVLQREIGSSRMGVRGKRDRFRAQRRSCRLVVEWTR
ncbi:MAG: methyltransferase domain-containing protein [Nocardioides sp.]